MGAGHGLGGVHGGGTGVIQQFSMQAGAHTCGHGAGQTRGSGAGVGTTSGGGASPVSVGGAVKKRKGRTINLWNKHLIARKCLIKLTILFLTFSLREQSLFYLPEWQLIKR